MVNVVKPWSRATATWTPITARDGTPSSRYLPMASLHETTRGSAASARGAPAVIANATARTDEVVRIMGMGILLRARARRSRQRRGEGGGRGVEPDADGDAVQKSVGARVEMAAGVEQIDVGGVPRQEVRVRADLAVRDLAVVVGVVGDRKS